MKANASVSLVSLCLLAATATSAVSGQLTGGIVGQSTEEIDSAGQVTKEARPPAVSPQVAPESRPVLSCDRDKCQMTPETRPPEKKKDGSAKK
jgi:hypothetical protein